MENEEESIGSSTILFDPEEKIDMDKAESSAILFDPEEKIDMDKAESSAILFDPEEKIDMEEKQESSAILLEQEGKIDMEKKEESSAILVNQEEGFRAPLAKVVAICEKMWFMETYKLARDGSKCDQLLLAQMYTCGYGVGKDLDKAQSWNTRGLTPTLRSEAVKPGGKRPGYGASESDSEDDDGAAAGQS